MDETRKTNGTAPKSDVKPHNPRKNARVHVGVDLQDLARKAATYGPLRVIGETVLNLCLLMNDQFRGQFHGSDITRKDENLRGRSGASQSRPGRDR
jgi:hypothetical protein